MLRKNMKYDARWPIFLMISSIILTLPFCPQEFAVHSEETTTERITFHNYSLFYKTENNSIYVYDGADTNGPQRTTAFQTTVDSQISGKVTLFGIEWTYWNGMIIWAYNLTEEVHVKGAVEITVYMSSSDSLSGLLSGGGYGMGLADVDENGNEIQRFVTEGPQSMGSNPLTSTPQAYTLSVEVDYVFAKDHAIIFFVGAGTTKQGYKFNVYFDSEDYNSGVNLQVVTPLPTPSPTPSPTPTSSPNESPSPSSSPNESPSPSSSPNESPSPSDYPSTSPTPYPSATPLDSQEIYIVALVTAGIIIATLVFVFLLRRKGK
jgi:Flp pilus assembly protein TadG